MDPILDLTDVPPDPDAYSTELQHRRALNNHASRLHNA